MPAVKLDNYSGIKGQADLWVRQVWPSALGAIGKFYGNPGIGDPACPAVQKFVQGARALGCADTSSSEFAWHGSSSASNVQSICWNNLDPGRRSGQAYGRGEYFSIDANVSGGYAGSTGYLIVFLLLKGSHNTVANGGSYRVVDNPTNGSMYCLPIGVVAYSSSGDPGLQGKGIFA